MNELCVIHSCMILNKKNEINYNLTATKKSIIINNVFKKPYKMKLK